MFASSLQTKLLSLSVAVAGGLFCFSGSGPAAQQRSLNVQAESPGIPAVNPAAVKVAVAAPQVPTTELQTSRVPSTVKADETPTASELIEGFTEPYADIDLAASEMGIVTGVMVEEGDEVKAGQMLAKLNDDVLTASLAVAKSAMSATGELTSATTQLELKQVEARKLAELFDRSHASQKEIDRVTGEVRIAKSRIVSVEEDLAVRRLEYARIQAQINQRHIRSPIDGVVVDVRKDKGEFVSPSDAVVARVVQLDPLLVVFSVPNEHRQHLKQNQTVSMRIAGTGVADGIVEHVSPTADASSGTFKVKVKLPNSDRRWYGGEKSELLLSGRTHNNDRQQVARNTK